MRVAFILYCPPSQYPNLARPRFVLQASKRSGHEILIVFLFWQQDVSNRTRLWYKTLCRTYRTPPANMEEESMWVCCRPPTPTEVKEQPSCRTRALCAVACASSRGHTKVYRLSTVLFVCPRPLLILVPFSKLKPENWHPVNHSLLLKSNMFQTETKISTISSRKTRPRKQFTKFLLHITSFRW